MKGLGCVTRLEYDSWECYCGKYAGFESCCKPSFLPSLFVSWRIYRWFNWNGQAMHADTEPGSHANKTLLHLSRRTDRRKNAFATHCKQMRKQVSSSQHVSVPNTPVKEICGSTLLPSGQHAHSQQNKTKPQIFTLLSFNIVPELTYAIHRQWLHVTAHDLKGAWLTNRLCREGGDHQYNVQEEEAVSRGVEACIHVIHTDIQTYDLH